MLTEGTSPVSSMTRLSNAYPVGSTLEEMDEAAALLDAELDAADPYVGNLEAWLRFQQGSLN